MRAWFSCATEFRALGQKYEMNEIKSHTKSANTVGFCKWERRERGLNTWLLCSLYSSRCSFGCCSSLSLVLVRLGYLFCSFLSSSSSGLALLFQVLSSLCPLSHSQQWKKFSHLLMNGFFDLSAVGRDWSAFELFFSSSCYASARFFLSLLLLSSVSLSS